VGGAPGFAEVAHFTEAWPDAEIVQQAVGQFPWGHNLVLLNKLKNPQRRLAYQNAFHPRDLG
jgi:predicted nuclease of restriction endonuclease-like (RecB) superfamily